MQCVPDALDWRLVIVFRRGVVMVLTMHFRSTGSGRSVVSDRPKLVDQGLRVLTFSGQRSSPKPAWVCARSG